MPKLIKAIYHSRLKVAEFIADDGRHLLRTGGTLPWRINNGGDLVSPTTGGQPSPKKTRDFIGFAQASERHFFIFPDYETGRREMLASLKRQHSGKTIPELTNAYVKEGAEANERYAQRLLTLTKIPKDKTLDQFTDAQMNALADGIELLEGYHNDKDSRKEIWVPVSRITATDGAYTLPDEEIVLSIDGKEKTLTSNALGQFPPIPHGQAAIDVKHRTPDGNLKTVGTIAGEQSKDFNLISRVRRFFCQTAPDKPAQPKPSRRQPFAYTVQPGDTLSKIAARFETSLDDIKRDNLRKSNRLFAGEVIGVYGPLSGQQLPVRPRPVPRRPAEAASSAAASAPTAPQPDPKPKMGPPPAHEVDAAARSGEGAGKPLAVMALDSDRAPWMKFAIAEAKYFAGKLEEEIEKERNYAADVRTGQTTIVGNDHAWCAAFVNWCLMKGGYPVENPSFNDRAAAKGRAHGFYEVEGAKAKKTDKHGPIVRNPLFVQVDQPIYGAIAMVTNAAGHGHHVGFVYAKNETNNLVLLGGNQSDQIRFANFNIKPVAAVYKADSKGVRTLVSKARHDHLQFFVPASYAPQASVDSAKNDLPLSSAESMNLAFGIQTTEKASNGTR